MSGVALDCFDKKYIFCGDYLVLREYSVPYVLHTQKEHSGDIKNYDAVDRVKRNDNLKHARDTVAQYIYTNLTPHTKFMTLTTKESILDVKPFVRKITTFLQAMKRNGYDLDYIYVLERQLKRGKKEGNIGALHAHFVVFNDEKIDLSILNKCWHYGRVELKMLDGLRASSDGSAAESVRNPAAYIVKYITKESVAEWNEKTFRTSKGLKKPVEINSTGYISGEHFTRSEVGEALKQHFNESYDVVYDSCKAVKLPVVGKNSQRLINTSVNVLKE